MVGFQDRRKGLGPSQAPLARDAGISRTALSLIENGRLRPSARTVQAIERGLDPFAHPALLVPGQGARGAAALVREVGGTTGLSYASTLDAAAWGLTRGQAQAADWEDVPAVDAWVSVL